jgi:hypothetical protein
MGWKVIIHLFKCARNMLLPIKETYNIINRSITIYIEYLEQAIKSDSIYDNINSNTIEFGNIFNFIHKKAFNDQSHKESTSSVKNSELNVSRMIKITETLLLWNNKFFTLENRFSICNKFLQSYVLLLNNDTLFYYCNVLEFLLEKMNMVNETNLECYTSFLTEYYLFVSHSKTKKLTESDINNMFLNKYYSRLEDFDNVVSIWKKEKNSKVFIKWVFAS